jgi:hypothetical protein
MNVCTLPFVLSQRPVTVKARQRVTRPAGQPTRRYETSAVAVLSVKRRRPVQQESTATLPTGIGLIRSIQTSELRQRPPSTSMPLVHTEEVTGSIPGHE